MALLRRQTAMKAERERTINEFEKEDEARTNMFLKKLREARMQQSELGNSLEAEQEAIVNRLMSQISALQRRNAALEEAARTAQEEASRWRAKAEELEAAARAAAGTGDGGSDDG